MSAATRIILILLLCLAISEVLGAQETTATTETTGTTETTATATATETTATNADDDSVQSATDTGEVDASERERLEQISYETRNRFTAMLDRQPSDELPTVLVMEPSLLTNQQFLQRYPELATFLKETPAVVERPDFFLAPYQHRRRRSSPLEEVMEALSILAIFVLIAFALAWFVRTIIEQKRWNRLSKTQSEVHNKILDRFGSSDELLQYIKTPAGTKFLESAPIPLHAERTAPNAPLGRVMWSIQIGVIIAAAALGLLIVSLRFDRDTAEDFFALGMISFCIGTGFIASALISIVLSRRLGVLQAPGEDAEAVK
jgi:hypothetical protein